jgi:cytochrome b
VSAMHRLRLYHAVLAVLAVAAYLTGELGLIHAWLGYAVAVVIVLRLAAALLGVRQLGLTRFYPDFEALRLDRRVTHPAISHILLLGIALSLIGTTATGIAMDRGAALGLGTPAEALPSDIEDDARGRGVRKREREHREEGLLAEAHEALANLLLGLVGLHVLYLLLFKRPLALYMLFMATPHHTGAEPSRG